MSSQEGTLDTDTDTHRNDVIYPWCSDMSKIQGTPRSWEDMEITIHKDHGSSDNLILYFQTPKLL